MSRRLRDIFSRDPGGAKIYWLFYGDPVFRIPINTHQLAQVGLAGRADMQAASLSHGEKRALELAMALAIEPRLMLLDEPMAGTGPDDAAGMVALLAGLKGQQTILLVEHDVELVMDVCHYIYVLDFGQLLFEGSPEAVASSALVRTAYLGEQPTLEGSH